MNKRQELEQRVEELRRKYEDAESAFYDAEYEYNRAEREYDKAVSELEKLDADESLDDLPSGCEVIAANAAREVASREHIIRVVPAEKKPDPEYGCRYLLCVTTPRGECSLQQWTAYRHLHWCGAVREAIEVGGFDR